LPWDSRSCAGCSRGCSRHGRRLRRRALAHPRRRLRAAAVDVGARAANIHAGQLLQPDLLLLIGRVLQVAPAALLADPTTDPVAIARLETDPLTRFQLVAQEIDGQSRRVGSASWVAYQAGYADVSVLTAAQRQYLPLAPILADAGWYSAQPLGRRNRRQSRDRCRGWSTSPASCAALHSSVTSCCCTRVRW
jgi:hypothetical protein